MNSIRSGRVFAFLLTSMIRYLFSLPPYLSRWSDAEKYGSGFPCRGFDRIRLKCIACLGKVTGVWLLARLGVASEAPLPIFRCLSAAVSDPNFRMIGLGGILRLLSLFGSAPILAFGLWIVWFCSSWARSLGPWSRVVWAIFGVSSWPLPYRHTTKDCYIAKDFVYPFFFLPGCWFWKR